MKKIPIFLFLLFQLSSFGQDKNYEKLFDDCKKTSSPNSCIMEIIRTEVQSEYEKYREEASILYDLQLLRIKYTVTKEGNMVIESIDGKIENFKHKIIELFKKFPKVEPITENGKPRDALMTTSFYLHPKEK